MRTTKDRNWQKVKDWNFTLEPTHQYDRLKNLLGVVDPLAVLSKLTATEMQVVVSLLAAANSLGHQQCRDQRRETLAGRFGDKDVYERRTNLKLISGGV